MAHNQLNRRDDNMVNKEAKQKDGFGLPSTDVRKKDNALIEAARIADKIAKWKAEFEAVIPKPKAVLEEAIEEPKGPTDEELEAIEKAKKDEAEAKAKADKKAKLQAELDALDG